LNAAVRCAPFAHAHAHTSNLHGRYIFTVQFSFCRLYCTAALHCYVLPRTRSIGLRFQIVHAPALCPSHYRRFPPAWAATFCTTPHSQTLTACATSFCAALRIYHRTVAACLGWFYRMVFSGSFSTSLAAPIFARFRRISRQLFLPLFPHTLHVCCLGTLVPHHVLHFVISGSILGYTSFTLAPPLRLIFARFYGWGSFCLRSPAFSIVHTSDVLPVQDPHHFLSLHCYYAAHIYATFYHLTDRTSVHVGFTSFLFSHFHTHFETVATSHRNTII